VQVRQLTARMKRIERTLFGLISSPSLTDAQREEILGCLTGSAAGRSTRNTCTTILPSKSWSTTPG
jgi:hypothetical protein